jgi:hypothetical protein
LAEAGVPEALYEYGNLALQDKYEALGCEDAIRLLKSASSKGYTPCQAHPGFFILVCRKCAGAAGKQLRAAVRTKKTLHVVRSC